MSLYVSKLAKSARYQVLISPTVYICTVWSVNIIQFFTFCSLLFFFLSYRGIIFIRNVSLNWLNIKQHYWYCFFSNLSNVGLIFTFLATVSLKNQGCKRKVKGDFINGRYLETVWIIFNSNIGWIKPVRKKGVFVNKNFLDFAKCYHSKAPWLSWLYLICDAFKKLKV